MTDRELLELAAQAAGELTPNRYGNDAYFDGVLDRWNPLTDDGDALRLAVKLRLGITFGRSYHFDDGPMTFCGEYRDRLESVTYKRFVVHGSDPYAATRRAIVRAAAEIGRSMK